MVVFLMGLLFSLSASAQTSCPNPGFILSDKFTAPTDVTNKEHTLNIPKFDPSKGELISVKMIAQACGHLRLDVDSKDPLEQTWTVIDRAGVIITLPNSIQKIVVFGTTPEGDPVTTAPDEGERPSDFAGSDWGFIEYGTPENEICSEEEEFNFNNPADMAQFIGPGTIEVKLRTFSNSAVLNDFSDNRDTAGGSFAGGNVRVEYEYCPPACIRGSKIDACTEEGLSGWEITLYNADTNAVIDTKETDASGNYEFCNLHAGNYRVCEETRDDWTPVTLTCYNVAESDFDNGDVELSPFENTQGSCISGYKYRGATSEEGLSGWTIQLKDSNGAVIKTTTTGTDGYYEFCGLTSGSYQVCEVLKTGWKALSPTCIDVTLTECTDSENNNFRNEPTTLVCVCPFFIKNDLYGANILKVKEVAASAGILANDPAGSTVLNPESITIDPKYGTLTVEADGSFVYDPTVATGRLYSGQYVIFKYTANNGLCDSQYPGIAKIQLRK